MLINSLSLVVGVKIIEEEMQAFCHTFQISLKAFILAMVLSPWTCVFITIGGWTINHGTVLLEVGLLILLRGVVGFIDFWVQKLLIPFDRRNQNS